MELSPRNARALLRILLPAIGAGLLIGFAFIFLFTSALHDPKPDGMKVGIVAAPPVEATIRSELDQATPGGFELESYATATDAREATREQKVNGAFVADPARPTLITAGALGSVGDVLHAAFGATAAAQGKHLAVEDIAPVPSHDARSFSAFFVVAGTTIGSLVFAVALYFLGGHGGFAPVRVRLALIAGFAIVAGLVFAADTEWVADGLAGHFFGVAGIVALLAASIALSIAAVVRWLGVAGLALCTLFFMLFSLPASGGAGGPEFVPAFYHSVATALPSHAAVQALKGVAYFEGGGVLGPVLILLAWITGALAAHLVAHLVRRPAPHPPVIGAMPELPAAG
ncbi:MAG: hypothetical protein ACRDPE_04015 [Solirubrobacterales bacterium]